MSEGSVCTEWGSESVQILGWKTESFVFDAYVRKRIISWRDI